MGECVCRVADANGRVFSHVEAASSLAEARQKMADRGLYVYSVDQRSSLLSRLLRRRERSIGGSDFLVLNRHCHTRLKARFSLFRSLVPRAERACFPKVPQPASAIRDRG